MRLIPPGKDSGSFNFAREHLGNLLPELSEIVQRRRILGISQRQLAGLVGKSQSAIAKIESGRVSPPYDLVKHIFEALERAQSKSEGRISDFASKPVVSIQKSDSVIRVLKILQTTGFKQVPVRQGERWVGCVYERTIARHIMETKNPNDVLRLKVGTIMDEALPIVMGDAPVSAIIPLLQATQAVLVSRKGRVTAIATNADLLRFIQQDPGKLVMKPKGSRGTDSADHC
ncbi:MAG TPA: CBS domain-containing protein [Nitrososphaerales archaeon]|nr:CBS domain-containing protein [Nitrososphaerales archaeon]